MSDLLKAMENQVMRNQLLELLQEAGPNGANEKVIAMAMKKAGYPVQTEQLKKDLYYLQKKNLIECVKCENKALKINMDVYMITPDGIDALEGTTEVPGIGVE